MTDTRPDVSPGGHPPDQDEGVRTDDWGTSGDLREQLTRALESRWNADDPGATTLDDTDDSSSTGSADTAATPDPAPDASPDNLSQGQSDEEGAGDGRAADDATGVAAAPDAPATPSPAPDDFDAGQYLNDYFGTNLTREQAEHLAGVIGGLQALTPDQRRMLDEALAGGQPYQYPATTGVPAQQTMQPQVAPQPSADDPAIAILGPRPDNDEYAAQQWDITARAVRYNHEQTAALRADIDAQTRAEMQRQQAANQARIDSAASSWRESYSDLSDGEFQAISDRAVRSGTFPALVAAHHGDVDAATRALYEQTFWSDPNLRARAIANISSGRAAGDSGTVDPKSPVAQSQAEVDAGRQALASSVSGGGGSVPRASTGVPADPEQRKAAMIAELQAQGDFT